LGCAAWRDALLNRVSHHAWTLLGGSRIGWSSAGVVTAL
jgi:hypothetical protein